MLMSTMFVNLQIFVPVDQLVIAHFSHRVAREVSTYLSPLYIMTKYQEDYQYFATTMSHSFSA